MSSSEGQFEAASTTVEDDARDVDPGQDATARRTDRGSTVGRLLSAGAPALVGNILAIGAFAAALGRFPAGWFIALGLLALIVPLVPSLLPSSGAGWRVLAQGITGRVALAVGSPSLAPDPSVGHWLAGALLAALVIFEDPLLRIERGAIPYGTNLPGGLKLRNRPLVPAFVAQLVNIAAMILVSVLHAIGAPLPVSVGVTVLAGALSIVVAADGVLRVRARRVAERSIADRTAAFAPRFLLHWDAPKDTGYQVTMWLPYLERLNVPFIVVVRNPGSFHEVAAATTAPVLLRRGAQDLDAMVAPSTRAAFYVNNSMRNSHMVRYPQLKHIQLNHGESDKAPSYSPVFRMFDKDFVAGQAAIDRFERFGVSVSPDLFEIVGRPQLENVAMRADGPIRTVLYAPTWKGHNADTGHSSLPIADILIEALLQRGVRVIYRPHPYTDRDAEHGEHSRQLVRKLAAHRAAKGVAHVFGPEATQRMSLTECFNQADALISDVSSVVGDFLYSLKPFAITAMDLPVDEFERTYPIAQAAYVLSGDGRNVESVLAELLGPDPRSAEREALKAYFLGDIPADRYADAFLTAAGRYVGAPALARKSDR